MTSGCGVGERHECVRVCKAVRNCGMAGQGRDENTEYENAGVNVRMQGGARSSGAPRGGRKTATMERLMR